ncbi:MAG: S-layer homology domain-containing protein [Monoglobaceae bacterium]
MKRLISFILAASMCISSAAFAVEDLNNTDNTINTKIGENDTNGTYGRDMNIVESLDIFSFFQADHMENDTVSRVDFLQAAMELVYIEVPYSNTKTSFTDVDSGDPSANTISLAVSMGAVDGKVDKFYPNESITFSQAVKILVTALGYGPLAVELGGYPAGFNAVAKKLDLTDGISVSADETVTAGMMAKLLLNAGFAEPLNLTVSTENIKIDTSRKSCVLWEVHSVDKGEGVLTGNGYTSLYSSKDSESGCLTIDNFKGMYYSLSAAEKYLGYYVEYFYRDYNSESVVLYIAPKENKNNVTQIDSEKIVSFNNGVLTYYTDANDSSKKQKQIPLNVSVIYNGKMVMEYSKSDFEDITGQITLVDNDKNGSIDVVNIINYDSIVVNAVDVEGKIIHDLLDPTQKIDYSEQGNWNYFAMWDTDGNRIKPEELQPKDVISVVKSKDSSYIRAIVNRQTITGNVEAKNEREGKNYITLDGREYNLEKRCYEICENKLAMGGNITAYIDVFGRIAYVENKSDKEGFALILKVISGDFKDDPYSICLMTSSGSIETYKLASKVSIDGVSYNSNSIPRSVENSDVIRYKLNDNKEIKWIDTPIEINEDGGSIHKVAEAKDQSYHSPGHCIGGSGLIVSSNMLVYVCPDSRVGADKDDFSISSTSKLVNTQKYTGVSYAVDPEALIGDVLVLKDVSSASALTHISNTAIVSYISQGVDQSEEEIYQITAKTLPGMQDITLKLKKDDKIEKNIKVDNGDIIKYDVDMKGYISALEGIFYADTLTLNHNKEADRNIALTGLNAWDDAEFALYWGEIVDKYGTVIKYKLDPDLLAEPKNHLAEYSIHDLSIYPAKVLVYDSNARKEDIRLSAGTINDICDEKHFGTGSKAIMVTHYARIEAVIIYK